jgi:hypothetical protein
MMNIPPVGSPNLKFQVRLKGRRGWNGTWIKLRGKRIRLCVEDSDPYLSLPNVPISESGPLCVTGPNPSGGENTFSLTEGKLLEASEPYFQYPGGGSVSRGSGKGRN